VSDHKTLENLFHLVHALKRRLHEQAEQLELPITPMHIRVLKIIDRKSPCTAIDIASFLGRDKAQVTRLLNVLIEQDLISREPNPGDKRSHYLRTTDRGIAIVEQIDQTDAETVKIMTQNLDADDVAAFQRIAQAMEKNLRSH